MKQIKRFKLIRPIVFLALVVVIVTCLSAVFKAQNILSETVTPAESSESTAGTYKSNFLNLLFEYPPEWGMATNQPEEHDYDDSKSEYIDFANKKNIFAVAGLYDRGGITNGVQLRTIETITTYTRNGKTGEILVHQDEQNTYWVEAYVLEKNRSSKFDYNEIFYIKAEPALTKAQMLQYKKAFQDLFASLTIAIH